MPLDGHLYLVSQGWRGKGTGLRDGAITRPFLIPQKKNLAGLGKDRDEAFPFWDHLFTAAAKSIQVKCSSDSDGEGNTENSSCSQGTIRRTTTGILCNRRPVEGTAATSTPTDSTKSRVTLLAVAKRDAAKQSLYSRFFRGPVLGPDDEQCDTIVEASLIVAGNRSIDSTAVIDVVKEGRASKRKRDLEGAGGGGPGRQKTERRGGEERQEGLNADKSKKKDKLTASHSVASGAPGSPKGIDSESERKRSKEEKKRSKVKKKRLE